MVNHEDQVGALWLGKAALVVTISRSLIHWSARCMSYWLSRLSSWQMQVAWGSRWFLLQHLWLPDLLGGCLRVGGVVFGKSYGNIASVIEDSKP